MLKEKRREQIYELLKRDGQVEISTLSKMFDVTEMTIRRDFDSLGEAYDIVRTHGGAMLPEGEKGIELPYERRIISNGKQKKKIAMKALSMIRFGQTLFFDSGSTAYYMAEDIGNDSTNTILTTGVNLAPELLNRQKLSVIMIGGDLRRNTISSCGPLAEEQLARFRVDVAFMGANGFDDTGCVYIGSVPELGIKHSVMRISKEKYLLVDSSKYQCSNLLCYAQMSEFDGVIIDSDMPGDAVQRLKEAGANIIIAE